MPQKIQRALLAALLGLALALGASWATGVRAPPVARDCNPGSCGGGG